MWQMDNIIYNISIIITKNYVKIINNRILTIVASFFVYTYSENTKVRSHTNDEKQTNFHLKKNYSIPSGFIIIFNVIRLL